MTRVALAALAALVLFPATAGAATTVTYSSTTGLRLEGNAAGDLTAVDAESNQFVVNGQVPGGVVPGSGCAVKSSIEVMCAYGSNRFVTANLGDGDDEFRVSNPSELAPPVDTLVNAGAGNDTLAAGKGPRLVRRGAGQRRAEQDLQSARRRQRRVRGRRRQ